MHLRRSEGRALPGRVLGMRPDQTQFEVGDVIRLISVGDWLLNGLSEEERDGILSCVGKEMTIAEIDKWGGIWVGFGTTTEEGEEARYVGQSFIVEPDRIELISKR